MVDNNSMRPVLQLAGVRFSNFLLRKISRKFKLSGMSLLQEFEMAVFPYCLRLVCVRFSVSHTCIWCTANVAFLCCLLTILLLWNMRIVMSASQGL